MFPSPSCYLLSCTGEAVFRSQSCLQRPLAQSSQPQSCARLGVPWECSLAGAPWHLGSLPFLFVPRTLLLRHVGGFPTRNLCRGFLPDGAGRSSPAKSPRAENTHWDGHRGSSRRECSCPESLQPPELGSVTIWESCGKAASSPGPILPAGSKHRALFLPAATSEHRGLPGPRGSCSSGEGTRGQQFLTPGPYNFKGNDGVLIPDFFLGFFCRQDGRAQP